MTSDIPYFTQHEIRATLYIQEINRELDQDQAATISTLAEESNWNSKYFTRAWKSLTPRGVIQRETDARNTRLSLTEKGHKIADHLKAINEALDQ